MALSQADMDGLLAQYAATDSIVLDLVTSMKKSANWDRTMIFVTADHGIAVNAIWPRVTIATAAIKNLLGGDRGP